MTVERWQTDRWPRSEIAPDPARVRETTLADLVDLGFPAPPENFPLVWDVGDQVGLRPTGHLLARCAVLGAVLSSVFGASSPLVCGWLEENGLREAVTAPEWRFLAEGQGSADMYGLHIEAVWGLSWVLGVTDELDPSRYCGDGLARWLPDVAAGEPFSAWWKRTETAPRPPGEVAALLDLHYCLDYAHARALTADEPPPGASQPYVVGQRRWALEWALVISGPNQPPPPPWDEVDLAG